MGLARGGQTKRLGKALKAYREERGRSLEAVAIKLRGLGFATVNKSTISKYEAGRPPDFALLHGLSRVYQKPFGDLCEAMAAELHGELVELAPAEATLSERAVAVAKAYDEGGEDFRDLVDSALRLSGGGRSTPGAGPAERARDPQAGGVDTRTPGRRARGRR